MCMVLALAAIITMAITVTIMVVGGDIMVGMDGVLDGAAGGTLDGASGLTLCGLVGITHGLGAGISLVHGVGIGQCLVGQYSGMQQLFQHNTQIHMLSL
jgi:hypothetical protein